jgi:hypothetical protein
MRDGQLVAKRVRDAARLILPRGARVGVEVTDPVAPLFTVSVRVGSVVHEMVTGWAGEGWPADVERLLRLAPGVDAVAAHAVSVGARRLLDERGVGWFDETGAANVVLASGLVVVREGEHRQPVAADAGGWTASTVAVAEAVLVGSSARVDEVERATGLSRGAVAKALAVLEGEELLARSVARGPASGRRVVDADRLLDRYAAAVAEGERRAPARLFHRLWTDPMEALTGELAAALDRAGVAWAVTGAAASMLLAPYLSNVTVVDLYVDEEPFGDVAQLERLLDARVVERGQRIEVRRAPTALTAVAGEVVNGVRCAPLPRVYADLAAKGGRFAEAAQHLRETRIDARASA